jgi:glutaredoxin-like protein
MEMLKTEVKEATRNKFSSEMSGRVTLLYFTQEPSRLVVPDYLKGQECLFCKETRQLLEEVAGLSDKIELVVYDFVGDKEKATEHAVNKIPAVVVRGEKDSRIRFFGIPSGYEYMSLIEAIVDVSRGSTGLSAKTKESLQALENDVHIQVFVTPTCPYCTVAVRLAHQCALESSLVRGEMIEATEFPHLAQKYHVFGVPKTVMNETVTVDGAVSEQVFLEHVIKAAGQGRK